MIKICLPGCAQSGLESWQPRQMGCHLVSTCWGQPLCQLLRYGDLCLLLYCTALGPLHPPLWEDVIVPWQCLLWQSDI